MVWLLLDPPARFRAEQSLLPQISTETAPPSPVPQARWAQEQPIPAPGEHVNEALSPYKGQVTTHYPSHPAPAENPSVPSTWRGGYPFLWPPSKTSLAGKLPQQAGIRGVASLFGLSAPGFTSELGDGFGCCPPSILAPRWIISQVQAQVYLRESDLLWSLVLTRGL